MATAKRSTVIQARNAELVQLLNLKRKRWTGRCLCQTCHDTLLDENSFCDGCNKKFCSNCLSEKNHEESDCLKQKKVFDCPSCGNRWLVIIPKDKRTKSRCPVCSTPICSSCDGVDLCLHHIRSGHQCGPGQYELLQLAEQRVVLKLYNNSERGDNWLKETERAIVNKDSEQAKRLIKFFETSLESDCVWPSKKDPISLWATSCHSQDPENVLAELICLISALLNCRTGSFSCESMKRILGQDILISSQNIEDEWTNQMCKLIEIFVGVFLTRVYEPRSSPKSIAEMLNQGESKKLIEELRALGFIARDTACFELLYNFCKNRLVSRISQSDITRYLKKRKRPDSDNLISAQ